MKKMRKLLPALAMLLVSAVMMSTASYAWFAMNTNVTAKGMTVNAKSNDTFLQIMDKTTGAIEGAGIEATASNDTADLYPATYDKASNKFKYSYSNDQNDEESSGTYYDVTGDLNDYRLSNTFKIFMKDSAADAKTKDLKVSGFTVTCDKADMLNAIRIVVKCGENIQELSAEGKTSGAVNSVDSAVTLAAEVTETGVEVEIMVYIDGDYETVYSNNVANLIGASVTVAFSTTQF